MNQRTFRVVIEIELVGDEFDPVDLTPTGITSTVEDIMETEIGSFWPNEENPRDGSYIAIRVTDCEETTA